MFLTETARQTIRGVMERLNDATEELARFLRETWEQITAGALRLQAPADRRQEADEPNVEFAGFAPGTPALGEVMVGHPLLLVRLGLAQRLLERAPN